MSISVNNEPGKNLSAKQVQAIGLLVQGMNQTDVAAQVGVDIKTVYRWRQNQDFQAELRRGETQLFEESISLLKRTMKAAILCLVRNMDSKVSAYVQVQAAKVLLEQGIEVHKISELEGKIEAFETLMKEAGLK